MAVTYENGIFGLIPEEEWLNVGFNVKRQNDPIDTLFGDEKTDNMVARWQTIANEYQVPMMAQFHGFDTEAQQTFRVPVDNHYIEKGLIKTKINQSELMREYTRSGIQSDEMADYILNDGIRLAEQVFTRTKVAKNELMATGKVTVKENNLDLTVDYGVPAAQTAYTLDLTQDEDVASQIQTIIDAATEKGITINGMMTSKKVLTKIRNNKFIQIAINGVNAQGAIVRQAALEDYLESEFGISTIITNDLTYGANVVIDPATGRPNVTSKRYYPANKVTFFATNPSGRLGVGLWGNPPEVDINGLGARVSAQGDVSPYVYVTQYAEKDPAVIWTKASGLFMPVLYNPNSLFIATVTNPYCYKPLTSVTVDAPNGDTDFWGTPASDLQTGVTVADNAITGTLKYLSEGQLVTDWGAGNFLALAFSNIDPKATSVKVGLDPSEGSGLVEIIDDPDKMGAFKITDKDNQVFKVVSTDGTSTKTQTFDLSGLTVEGE